MTWEEALLKVYDYLGGEGSNEHVYSNVERFKPLTGAHFHPQWGKRPAYANQVRSHAANLRQKGDLIAIGKGQNRLTPKGRRRVASIR
jgi:hypothetical protein